MPRGDQKFVEPPFRVWVVTVDQQNRLRIPLSEIGPVVPWLNVEEGTIECVAAPGPWSGIQISTLVDYEQEIAPFAAALSSTPMNTSESGHQWVDVTRLLATAWLIAIHIETSRITLTLPEPPRRAQQLPQAGGAA